MNKYKVTVFKNIEAPFSVDIYANSEEDVLTIINGGEVEISDELIEDKDYNDSIYANTDIEDWEYYFSPEYLAESTREYEITGIELIED